MQIMGYFNPGVPPMPTGTRSTKKVLVMKSIILFFFMVVLHISGSVSAQTVTFTSQSASLQKVFASIRQQTGYKFFYRNEDLQDSKPVTVQLKDMPLIRTLQIILANQPLTYNIQGKTIFISRKASSIVEPAAVEAVNHSYIVGTVKDDQGQPLPNITVMLRNRYRYVITNEKGIFTLYGLVPDDTLQFSSINHESVVVPYFQLSENMTVIMRSRISALSAVTIYNTGDRKSVV